MLEGVVNHGLWLVAILSGVPLALSAVMGLAVAIVQAATQIQEQSIAYAVKFLALAMTIFFGGPYFWEIMTRFLQQSLAGLAAIR